jgi:hypothetical protein
MKNLFPITLLFLAVTFFASCKKDKNDTQKGNTATLSWLQCIDFTDHDLTICFIGAEEYRCPCTMDCVSEGAIDFTLQVQGQGIDTTVVVSTDKLSKPHAVIVGGVSIVASDDSNIFCDHYKDYEKYTVKVELIP